MSRERHSQILVMRKKTQAYMFINTANCGLVQVNLNALGDKKTLDKEDLKVVEGVPAGYSVTALFTDRRDN